MARQARGEYLNPNDVQIVHCVQRCVRQAYLCGVDKNSGNDYEGKAEGDTRKRVDARLPYPYNQTNLPLIYGE